MAVPRSAASARSMGVDRRVRDRAEQVRPDVVGVAHPASEHLHERRGHDVVRVERPDEQRGVAHELGGVGAPQRVTVTRTALDARHHTHRTSPTPSREHDATTFLLLDRWMPGAPAVRNPRSDQAVRLRARRRSGSNFVTIHGRLRHRHHRARSRQPDRPGADASGRPQRSGARPRTTGFPAVMVR